MSESPNQSAARWLVGGLIVGLIALSGFIAYEHYLVPPTGGAEDPRLARFLSEGEVRLASGELELAEEQFHKASGVAESDVRVQLGLARVEVARAETLALALIISTGEAALEPQSPELARVRAAVQEARRATAVAAGKASDHPGTHRLRAAGHRVSAMFAYLLAMAGEEQAARDELARIEAEAPAHPLVARLKAWLEEPPPAASASASASAAPVAARSRVRRRHPPSRGDFEFDHEPEPPVKTPGELEIPVPSPAPAVPSPEP